jgi:1-acyl-sn-glycerol-3-phosphate acyltransferase
MQNVIYSIIWFFSWIILVPIFKIFVKFEAIGRENLKEIKKGPAIFISNHECYFDPWIMGMGMPLSRFNLYPIYYMASDKLFKKKLLSIFLWLNGTFPGKVGSGVDKAMEQPSKFLKEKKSVAIFPEWCYETEPEVSRIQDVISLLSIKNNIPIIPVFIYGIFDGGISWKKVFSSGRSIKIVFGKPVYPQTNISKEEFQKMFNNSHTGTRVALIKSFHEEEKKFWSHYAKFYYYLERAEPYGDLMKEFSNNLPKIIRGKWLDLGSGSGAIVEMLNKKAEISNSEHEITATDIEAKMLDYLTNRFKNNKNIKIKELDLAKSFDLPKNNFNGVTASLVLPYLIHHEGEIGKKGFIKIFNGIFEILKPGGVFVWSTPKKGVSFLKVFLASWKNILDYKNLENIYYGPAIFKQALQIQNKGKREIYHFLDIKEIEKILKDIGFINISFSRSMAGQVDIIRCEKP